MKKNSILALGLLALALSVSSFAIGAGMSSLGNNAAVAVKAESDTLTTYVHGDMTGLSSTATTGNTTIKSDDGIEYVFSKGAKKQGSSGSSKLAKDKSAVLIGKKGAYIYNTTPFENGIKSFRIYANKGASDQVSIGVYFSSDPISKYSDDSAQYTETLSKLDSVYDLTSKVPEGAKYFWYQVANAYNSQVQFEITYKTTSEDPKPSVTVTDGAEIDLRPNKTASYALVSSNLPTDCSYEASVVDSSVAEVSLSEDETALNVSAKSIGSTDYTVSVKDSSGSVVASFDGIITVADKSNEPVTISFGSASGSWNFNAASATFKDSEGISWTGTATGTTYFSSDVNYSRIGSGNNPASSILVKGALNDLYSVDSVVANFSGFKQTVGNIVLKAGSTVIGTGALNADNNVAVSSSSSAFADSISFEITNIAAGVKLISLTYSISEISDSLFTEVDNFVATWITPYSGDPEEGDSCKTKYEYAALAYDELSDKAQELFNIHTKYAEAKAVYDYWDASINPTNGKGSPLSAVKTADWASMSSLGFLALGGVVVAGLVFVNKKKAE